VFTSAKNQKINLSGAESAPAFDVSSGRLSGGRCLVGLPCVISLRAAQNRNHSLGKGSILFHSRDATSRRLVFAPDRSKLSDAKAVAAG
jgi:hypothetical protein